MTPQDQPSSFYRVAACGLIFNETRDKFLIVLRDDGEWELPGGGWDHGETGPETVVREIQEEMGLKAQVLREQPDFLFTHQVEKGPKTGLWKMAAVYETTVEHLDFTPTEECRSIRFVDHNDLTDLPVFPRVKMLAALLNTQ